MRLRFILLLIIAFPLIASSEDVVVNGIRYTLDDAKMSAEAAGLVDSTITQIVIPASIKYDGKNYEVQSIGYMAFADNFITSFSLPEGLKTIETGAFIYTWKLEQLTIPNSVESIGSCAFEHS